MLEQALKFLEAGTRAPRGRESTDEAGITVFPAGFGRTGGMRNSRSVSTSKSLSLAHPLFRPSLERLCRGLQSPKSFILTRSEPVRYPGNGSRQSANRHGSPLRNNCAKPLNTLDSIAITQKRKKHPPRQSLNVTRNQ